MSAPPATHACPQALLEAAWELLARGVHARRSPARYPALATVAEGGGATARVVVLRGADRAAARLTLHTDAASAKAGEIAAEPRGALLFRDPGSALQLRCAVRLALRPETAEEWRRVPSAARSVYGGKPAPGRPLDDPATHSPGPDPARFAVVEALVEQIDALHLGRERHLRARFLRREGFGGRRLCP